MIQQSDEFNLAILRTQLISTAPESQAVEIVLLQKNATTDEDSYRLGEGAGEMCLNKGKPRWLSAPTATDQKGIEIFSQRFRAGSMLSQMHLKSAVLDDKPMKDAMKT